MRNGRPFLPHPHINWRLINLLTHLLSSFLSLDIRSPVLCQAQRKHLVDVCLFLYLNNGIMFFPTFLPHFHVGGTVYLHCVAQGMTMHVQKSHWNLLWRVSSYFLDVFKGIQTILHKSILQHHFPSPGFLEPGPGLRCRIPTWPQDGSISSH